jgi:hypothetical protein
MEAYKVVDLDQMGFEDKPMYYLCPKQAEKDFYSRLRKVLKEETLADKYDVCDEHERPWKVEIGRYPHRPEIILRAYYWYWYESCTQDGCEGDTARNEIVIERINIV